MSAWLLVRLLESAGGDAFLIGAGLLAALVVLSAAVAGAAQSVHGRVDLRLGHRVLSGTLGVGAVVALLAVAGFSHWYTAVDLGDLDRVEILAASPDGPWVAVANRSRHRPDYYPTLLVDTRTGVATRLERCNSFPTATFSRDGRVFAWIQRPGVTIPSWVPAGLLRQRLSGGAVRIASLDGSTARVSVLPISVEGARQASLVLSDDGGRLALLEERTVSVVELPSGALIASVAVPEDARRRWVYFLDAEHLRMMTSVARDGGNQLEILDLDLAEKRVVGRHSRDLGEDELLAPLVDRDSDRMLLPLRSHEHWRPELTDAATGQTTSVLEPPTGWTLRSLPQFISGGRAAVGVQGGTQVGIAVFDGGGALEHLFPLPGKVSRCWLFLGGEVTPMELLVTRWDGKASYASFVVELESGTVRPVANIMRPAWWLNQSVDPTASPKPGGQVSRLALTESGRLEILDPATLELQDVVAQ